MSKEFIASLGGPKKVSERLNAKGHDVTAKAVTAWTMRGAIPWKWRLPLGELAREDRLEKGCIPYDVAALMPVLAEPKQAEATQ